jgi:murein L,D-transpeptidase YafK
LSPHRTIALFLLCAPAFAESADHIVVLKSKHQMQLWHGTKLLHTYTVALGGNPVGPKHFEGDHRTPEGSYVIDSRNVHSKYYKSVHISYPNASDRAYATAQHRRPGGDIMIHGLPNGFGYLGAAHRLHDWTDGCIAITNAEMDEIWSLVPTGTKIEIKP